MRQPAALAFMLGSDSPETLAELRAAMLRWAEQGDDRPIELRRFLGLGTVCKARQALRNALVVDASALLVGGRWQRCKQLAAMAAEMNARRYSVWVSLGVPPDVGEAWRLLFHARHYGEPLPESDEAYLNILPGPI